MPPTPCLSLALCGNIPQNMQFSPHFLPLKTPGTSSCRLLPLLMVIQARSGFPGHWFIVQETKTTKDPAWGCWGNMLREHSHQGLRVLRMTIHFSKTTLTYLRKNRSSNHQQGHPQEGCRGSIFHHKTRFEMYLKIVSSC